MERLWFVLVVAACGSQPKAQPTLVGNTTVSAQKPTLEVALPINRERVHFEPDRAVLGTPETIVLDRVVKGLKAERDLVLQVSGHADPSESDAGVSQARATVVRDYLIAHGIDKDRLLLRAAGSEEPRDPGATEHGRAANRRVELERVTITRDPIGGRVIITDSDVEILDPVTFEPGKVTLERTSFPALDAVVSTLQGNPSILLVEVQSHVDDRGDEAANLRLTEARAIVVRNYLVAKGVDPARLTSHGYGETQPLERGHDEAARAKNTRIAFIIVTRTP